MNILVTGGAGYIGSAAVKALIARGDSVAVVDDLSKGSIVAVDKKARFYKINLADKEKLEKVFRNKVDAVMHFAGYKAVEESMQNPEKYSSNIIGTINLLNIMAKYKVKKLIFSSSAAVYGVPLYVPMDEKHPTNPINYYGFTKLECEEIIEWYSRIHEINHVSLRYFNVAGDSGIGYVDPNAMNIFPIIMEVLNRKRDKFVIFGNDYDTRDGTCVRDYIDINDLVRAHILALNVDKNEVINLGSSKGISVKELVRHTIKVTGKELKYEFGPRRAGDCPVMVASNKKAKRILGWGPKKTVKEMIRATCKAYGEGSLLSE